MNKVLLLILAVVLCAAVAAGVWLYSGHEQPPASTSTTTASASNETPKSKDVSFKKLDQGSNSKAVASRKNYAIYDQAEFNTFWQQAHGDDGTKAPPVDFTKNYVIGVFAGTEPTGGYTIAVSHITDTGDARSVSVVIEQPDENCVVIQEQTSPYEFVSVPWSDAEALAHTDEIQKKNCPLPH